MEINYSYRSPLLGWAAGCNQDFREGAKELNSLHPASLSTTKQNSFSYDGHLDEWMEIREEVGEALGYSGLEAFSDVILSDEQEFKAENYSEFESKFVFEDHFHQNNEDFDSLLKAAGDLNILNSQPSHTSYESLVCDQVISDNEQKVTIKLKKIKVRKKSIENSIRNYSNYDYDILANTPPEVDRSPSPPTEIIVSESLLENELLFDADIDVLECFEQPIHSWDNCDEIMREENVSDNLSSTLTLKDALNMENADFLLENCLSPSHSIKASEPQSSSLEHWISSPSQPKRWTSSPSPVEQWTSSPSPVEQWTSSPSPVEQWTSSPSQPERWASSPSSPNQWTSSPHDESLIEEVFSPISETSQNSYIEEIPSSSKENYSADSVLPAVYSLEDVLDLPPKSKSRKPKRQREKLSQESRYLRKKEQNKQAALRYRAKKKQEDEQLMKTLEDEEGRKDKLKEKQDKLKQEVQFMKKLLRETFIAKGLVSPNAFH